MTSSKEFLLLLLDSSEGILESETRIQKLAFLGIKEKGLSRFTQFVWEKYGPLSTELWKTLRKMKRQGFLDIKEETRFTSMGDPYKIRVFQLTEKGRLEASKIKEIHDDTFVLIKELYSNYGKEPLDSLLNYVHTAYSPEDL